MLLSLFILYCEIASSVGLLHTDNHVAEATHDERSVRGFEHRFALTWKRMKRLGFLRIIRYLDLEPLRQL